MGVAALVLGIISIIVGFVPFCGAIAFVPAVVGLILGIVDIVKKNKENKPKGLAIAGTVLTAIAIVIITFWLFVFGAAASKTSKYVSDHDGEIRSYFNDFASSIQSNY